jgi:hypothetical protein
MFTYDPAIGSWEQDKQEIALMRRKQPGEGEPAFTTTAFKPIDYYPHAIEKDLFAIGAVVAGGILVEAPLRWRGPS